MPGKLGVFKLKEEDGLGGVFSDCAEDWNSDGPAGCTPTGCVLRTPLCPPFPPSGTFLSRVIHVTVTLPCLGVHTSLTAMLLSRCHPPCGGALPPRSVLPPGPLPSCGSGSTETRQPGHHGLMPLPPGPREEHPVVGASAWPHEFSAGPTFAAGPLLAARTPFCSVCSGVNPASVIA